MPLTLVSPAFADGERLPEKYTRDGENLSPPLKWTGVPEGTKSFVLIIEDPDAPSGTFHHWGLSNIPADWDTLAESVETGPDKARLRVSGNDFGNTHYDGPEPPRGHGPHRYFFRLAALDVPSIELPSEAGIAALWKEAGKHKLEEATLLGTYER
ncbi:YbhB/YbcL family Raf kinase inhibitor-like protein [Chelativorans sp. M5D2P16]|uniref:YbhB/YbcL family Raf kinase inhibitor-like protein n=1 Tax=Chelativorans sp. M5D2P16 TaxID=3095678 RepID=UPI002AC9F822|nr:YbhB/YbcL family Raf kinase inhibitor-like protein [Chelativorans sp. M5D2P16]MDZ5695901.1 YbhB/YbcL family Raf kinase inhibitor-like protein [Chelativorans sp. M5D2P16]